MYDKDAKVIGDSCCTGTSPWIDEALGAGFKFKNGKSVFAYWNPTDLETMTYNGKVKLLACPIKGKPTLIDPIEGCIYELDEKEIRGDLMADPGHTYARINPEISEKEGEWNLQLSLRNYPLFLCFE